MLVKRKISRISDQVWPAPFYDVCQISSWKIRFRVAEFFRFLRHRNNARKRERERERYKESSGGKKIERMLISKRYMLNGEISCLRLAFDDDSISIASILLSSLLYSSYILLAFRLSVDVISFSCDQ